MSLKLKAIHGFLWSLFDKLINQLGYLAVTVYLARIIGPDSFGLIGMLSIFVLMAESTISHGFSQALVQRSNDLTDEDSSTIFYVNIFWGIFIYFVLYFLAPFIAEFYRQPLLVDISRWLFLVVIINSLSVVVRAKLIIDIDFKSQAFASNLSTIISSAVGILMALNGFSYWSFVCMLILKSVLTTLLLWFNCRWVPKLVFSFASFKSLFGFGANLMLAGLVSTFVNNLYVALIGRYFSSAHVGYYTQAYNLSNYLSTFISSVLQGVSYPVMASIKDQPQRMISVYSQMISLSIMLSFPLLLGFASVAEESVKIFLGDEWAPVVPVLVALCFARMITPVSVINMNLLNVIGRPDLFLKIDLLKLPLTLGALYLALPYGIYGLALASIITSLISYFINSYFPGKMFGFGAFKQLVVGFKYMLASFCMFFILMFFNVDNPYLSISCKFIFGVVFYVLFLVVSKDKHFFDFISLVRKKIKP